MADKKDIKVSETGLNIYNPSGCFPNDGWKEDSMSYRAGFRDGNGFAVQEYHNMMQTVMKEKFRDVYDLKEQLMAMRIEKGYYQKEAEGKRYLETLYVRLLDDLRNHFKEYLDAPDDVLEESGLKDLAPYLKAKDVYFEALHCSGRAQKQNGLFTPLSDSTFDEEFPF